MQGSILIEHTQCNIAVAEVAVEASSPCSELQVAALALPPCSQNLKLSLLVQKTCQLLNGDSNSHYGTTICLESYWYKAPHEKRTNYRIES